MYSIPTAKSMEAIHKIHYSNVCRSSDAIEEFISNAMKAKTMAIKALEARDNQYEKAWRERSLSLLPRNKKTLFHELKQLREVRNKLIDENNEVVSKYETKVNKLHDKLDKEMSANVQLQKEIKQIEVKCNALQTTIKKQKNKFDKYKIMKQKELEKMRIANKNKISLLIERHGEEVNYKEEQYKLEIDSLKTEHKIKMRERERVITALQDELTNIRGVYTEAQLEIMKTRWGI